MKKGIVMASLLAMMSVITVRAQVYLDTKAPIEERIKDALSRMTVHEKIQILHAQTEMNSHSAVS